MSDCLRRCYCHVPNEAWIVFSVKQGRADYANILGKNGCFWHTEPNCGDWDQITATYANFRTYWQVESNCWNHFLNILSQNLLCHHFSVKHLMLNRNAVKAILDWFVHSANLLIDKYTSVCWIVSNKMFWLGQDLNPRPSKLFLFTSKKNNFSYWFLLSKISE